MNKLFIGLLIIAAGTGVFFLLKKKKPNSPEAFGKELIIGKWKEAGKDSSDLYVFEKELVLMQKANDSIASDTSFYAWNENSILWKEKSTDSTGRTFLVQKLTKDTLQLQAADSTVVILIRGN